MRSPNFNNILRILNRKTPDRPTLFEMFMNPLVYSHYCKDDMPEQNNKFSTLKLQIRGFKNAGYDYATIHGSDLKFLPDTSNSEESISLNEKALITDRETFNRYDWPDPDVSDYTRLTVLAKELPSGMKFIVMGPGGVLENVIWLTGFDNLCYMIIDNPSLAADIFDAVGSRLLRYYEICSSYESAGALISNDDWGFNTQTMLAPHDMKKYVFPWHKRIVKAIHNAGKHAILHSCGNLEAVMDDIIQDIAYDAKHSFEDNILPVEEAYERLCGRIAILGGIDINFLCSSTPDEIQKRSADMLQRSIKYGGYGLGSGNSIPEYVPLQSYQAMIKPAFL